MKNGSINALFAHLLVRLVVHKYILEQIFVLFDKEFYCIFVLEI